MRINIVDKAAGWRKSNCSATEERAPTWWLSTEVSGTDILLGLRPSLSEQ